MVLTHVTLLSSHPQQPVPGDTTKAGAPDSFQEAAGQAYAGEGAHLSSLGSGLGLGGLGAAPRDLLEWLAHFCRLDLPSQPCLPPRLLMPEPMVVSDGNASLAGLLAESTAGSWEKT